MDPLDLRETVSAATHGVALLAAIPASVALARRAGTARLDLVAYGVGLVACFAASTACHALAIAGLASPQAVVVDHMAIYLLIAGTYTPIARTLLPEAKRGPTLRIVWAATTAGIALNLIRGPLPAPVATAFYLAMGWGGLWCYVAMRPALSHRQLAAVPIGGVLYTVGAAFHVARWPTAWPALLGPHELFHLLVMAGAATHYGFIARFASRPEPRAGVPPPPKLLVARAARMAPPRREPSP